MVKADKPDALRSTIGRLRRRISERDTHIERLTRMVLLERLKDGDIDFSEGLALLDEYRPVWDGADGFDEKFSLGAVTEWLAARRPL